MKRSLFLLLFIAPLSFASQKFKDFTSAKLEDFGIKPVEVIKDEKTGFLVGGKNSTDVIRKLTEINGIKISTLETRMRPGKLSRTGFIGKDESLVKILADDNDLVLDKLGLTHQELGRHLHILCGIGVKYKGDVQFMYHGRHFKVSIVVGKGYMDSPFEDETKGNTNVTITNVTKGKSIMCSTLMPYMIERYGFYEGKDIYYRVDPVKVVEVLDFLIKKK